MQEYINIVLRTIKWPIAVLMVLLFMPTLEADMIMVKQTIDSAFFMKFMAPMFGMIVLWFIIPGLNGSHFAIFEHEFTHMFAALLTFHMPKSMQVESDKGGSFSFYGEGNWLITLAPYFVPTFPILMMFVSLFWTWGDGRLPEMFIPVLGMMFGYHLISNAMQIHPGQTDFPKAGWLFSLLFLPTANLITFGFVWGFAVRGWGGSGAWWRLLGHQASLWLDKIF